VFLRLQQASRCETAQQSTLSAQTPVAGVALPLPQTKSYFIVMDWGREELLLDWVRALLQCIK
jgi:hypothetical protein